MNRAAGPTVAVVGSRGFPDVQGGVERHCEELYRRLAARGYQILAFTRSPYRRDWARWATWQGITVRKVWAPRNKYLEAIWHSAAAVLLAFWYGVPLVHVHAIGPGLVVPLARLLGRRVVFTHHGFDYRRAKWGGLARLLLRVGEAGAVRWASAVLAVSREIQGGLAAKYGRTVTYAPNGVVLANDRGVEDGSTLGKLGLVSGEYAIGVGRLVPEKGWEDLFAAVRLGVPLPRVVIAGAADTDVAYAERLRREAPPSVTLLGAVPHERLVALVRNARLFILPSHHEGLPIAVLEAMAHGVLVVVSDIEAHREVVEDGVTGFLAPCGDPRQLAVILHGAWMLKDREVEAIAARGREQVRIKYSWDKTVDCVEAAYREASGAAAR